MCQIRNERFIDHISLINYKSRNDMVLSVFCEYICYIHDGGRKSLCLKKRKLAILSLSSLQIRLEYYEKANLYADLFIIQNQKLIKF